MNPAGRQRFRSGGRRAGIGGCGIRRNSSGRAHHGLGAEGAARSRLFYENESSEAVNRTCIRCLQINEASPLGATLIGARITNLSVVMARESGPSSTPQLCRDGKTVPQPGTGVTGSPAFAGDDKPRGIDKAGLS